jgi:hypothetical protein
MRLIVLMIIILTVLTLVPLLKQATVMVGDQKVVIPESRLVVFLLNTFGDWRGFSRCSITGLSFGWGQNVSLIYDKPGFGVIFSSYAVDTLMKMNPTKAYNIAQTSFNQLQSELWVSKGHKLLFPLRLL